MDGEVCGARQVQGGCMRGRLAVTQLVQAVICRVRRLGETVVVYHVLCFCRGVESRRICTMAFCAVVVVVEAFWSLGRRFFAGAEVCAEVRWAESFVAGEGVGSEGSGECEGGCIGRGVVAGAVVTGGGESEGIRQDMWACGVCRSRVSQGVGGRSTKGVFPSWGAQRSFIGYSRQTYDPCCDRGCHSSKGRARCCGPGVILRVLRVGSAGYVDGVIPPGDGRPRCREG